MVTITVAGTARRFLPAERGTVYLRATREARRSADVVPVVADLHARLSADAERHVTAGAATRWWADHLYVSTVQRYRRDSDVSETFQVAAAGISVRFSDFGALSAWVTDVGSVDGVVVDGVEWELTRAHRTAVEREVRAEAVRDAQERADAYAAELGYATATATALYEPGLRPHTQPGFEGTRAYRVVPLAADSAGGAVVSMRPEQIEITATVTVDYLASGSATRRAS
ncbi:SIMPL domain-containing protein [Jiangella rhizosphaerae]|uniref:SIMPL domain-containing protein n=1 Tax=Jiangella rhizosphaerae TaxID=2293569 RepID=A0A418KUY9_9ACTN|nr:SIMPL domain-containing protein [Jiangella rhizosphaerae]RIQ31177.1 SIMPL domain-containing protein [Jiangella rhizosphaerae]